MVLGTAGSETLPTPTPSGMSPLLRRVQLLLLAAMLLSLAMQVKTRDMWASVKSDHVVAKVKSWHLEPRARRPVVRATWTRHNTHMVSLPAMFQRKPDPQWDF